MELRTTVLQDSLQQMAISDLSQTNSTRFHSHTQTMMICCNTHRERAQGGELGGIWTPTPKNSPFTIIPISHTNFIKTTITVLPRHADQHIVRWSPEWNKQKGFNTQGHVRPSWLNKNQYDLLSIFPVLWKGQKQCVPINMDLICYWSLFINSCNSGSPH